MTHDKNGNNNSDKKLHFMTANRVAEFKRNKRKEIREKKYHNY